MKYELAKELKDAGFPQREPLSHRPYQCGKTLKEQNEMSQCIYIPNLDELIEACGKDFGYLARKGNGFIANSDGSHEDTVGKTPEEAVAKLYIKLKKI